MNSPFSRRHFLYRSAALTAATLAGHTTDLLWAQNTPRPKPTADTVILLWMGGGMAQTETFDPKRYTAYEVGVRSADVLSTFPSIDTAVDGVKFSAGLEKTARVMDRGMVVRSVLPPDLGRLLHSRHQFHWHTGYEPPQSVAVPHLGSIIAKVRPPERPDIPGFVDIGQKIEGNPDAEILKVFHSSGFLGMEYAPFFIPDPRDAVSALRPPAAMSSARFKSRYETYRTMMAGSPVLKEGSDSHQQSLLRAVENAHRLVASPAAKAFDLSLEPKARVDAYNTGRFGLGCLLALRLAEVGVRFIEVTTEYVPFLRWDTHVGGHERTAEMKREVDAPIAQLVLDLEERGLLHRTLVIVGSEFGRDMLTEGRPERAQQGAGIQPERMSDTKHYGMHRHFTGAQSVLLFGGGMKRGLAYGKTADERPMHIVDKPIPLVDLQATILQAAGVPPDLAHVVEKRPVYVTKDGKAKPVADLFA